MSNNNMLKIILLGISVAPNLVQANESVHARIYCEYVPTQYLSASSQDQVKNKKILKLLNKSGYHFIIPVELDKQVYSIPHFIYENITNKCEELIKGKGQLLNIVGTDDNKFFPIYPLGEGEEQKGEIEK